MREDSRPNVGVRLRTFRERQGWSLRTLADRCGLSINAISRIERGENSPTVSSLHRLALALSVPITDFFMEKAQQAAVLVRRGLGQRTHNSGYAVEHLGVGLPNQQLEPFLLTVEPGCRSAEQPVFHPGEEFVHCLEGEVQYCVGDQVFLLGPGDSLLFQAMLPHYWSNPGEKPAKLLLVFQAAQDNTLARQKHMTG